MFRIANGLFTLTLYTCVATVLAEGLAVAYLYKDSRLDREAMEQAHAVVYGYDLKTIRELIKRDRVTPQYEPIDLAELQKRRAKISLDLDLRENAIEKGVRDLRYIEFTIARERERYDEIKEQFFLAIDKRKEGRDDQSLEGLRKMLEQVDPEQAKDEVIAMLMTARREGRPEIDDDVVTLFKTMQVEKRKKIISEFETDEEQDWLRHIFRQIQEGVPDVPLIRETRKRLQEFSPKVDQENQA